MRVGYLGPPGTYSEEALIALIGDLDQHEATPYGSVFDCFEAVRKGEVDTALVPIENSIEGSVRRTLDQLAFGTPTLVIRAEIVHPIRHCLITRDGVEIGDITEVISHTQATAQCQAFLRQELPGIPIGTTSSTADAVRLVATGTGNRAAIGTARAASLYGARVLRRSIADVDDNNTRFVLVGREPADLNGAEEQKTSIVCRLAVDGPGALAAILQVFVLRDVNLSRLESRPDKTGLGRYVFFIDIDGGMDQDATVRQAVSAIDDWGVAEVIMLGSYPVAGPSA